MKKILRKIALVLASILVAFAVIQTATSSAKVPYKTYTENCYGEYVETQTAYIPTSTIIKVSSDIEGIDSFTLKKPQDIKVEGDKLYIADTGAHQIVVTDLKGNLIQVIDGDGALEEPMGVFVTEEYIYVADSKYVGKKEGAVIVFDHEGNLVKEYKKPDDVLYGSSRYQPEKIIVDSAGIMYISSKGNSNGVIQISPSNGGTFLGYFGTNAVEVSAMRKLMSIILTDAQEARMMGSIPASVNNLAVDSKGLIYTVTSSAATSSIKKLNIAGVNSFVANFYPTLPVAVAVGQYDNIYVGTQDGYIYEYTSEG